MPKDICVLDIREATPGFVNVRVLFWIAVAAGYKVPGATSAYPDITTDPATSSMLAAIQAGTVVEESYTFLFPVGWISGQWATVKAALVAFLTARKAQRAGTQGALPDPGFRYAVLHDTDTTWSA